MTDETRAFLSHLTVDGVATLGDVTVVAEVDPADRPVYRVECPRLEEGRTVSSLQAATIIAERLGEGGEQVFACRR
jgi:hypothetical protein